MKFLLPGNILLMMIMAFPLEADPAREYTRINGKMVVTLRNIEKIPYYCTISYTDGTVDRKVIAPQRTMKANKFKQVREIDCT